MNDVLLKNYAKAVDEMRSLQRSYFAASAVAKKTRKPELLEAAKALLKRSRAAELKVDKLTEEILPNPCVSRFRGEGEEFTGRILSEETSPSRRPAPSERGRR